MMLTTSRTQGATEQERFMTDVLTGLSARPKEISPKWFYDRAGSALFDAICELPEYYLTRAELSIVTTYASSIAGALGARVRVVEPGAGSSTKTRILLRALGRERCAEYVPVDISREHLMLEAKRLASELPWLRIRPHAADFTVDLPSEHGALAAPTVVYFPGSTLGNFEPRAAQQLLARFAATAGPRGFVLVGLDLKKDPAALHAAYNDAQGVTAAFNKNLLARMNRELDASFDLDAFAHHALYEPVKGRVEMHLVSLGRQSVPVAGRRVVFADGESIRTECSYKYDLPQAERLARTAGLELADAWLDDARRFAVLLFRPSRTIVA